MFNGLNFVMMHVPDLAAARAYFVERLGFAVEQENDGFVQFRSPASGATLALGHQDGGAPIELWWYVDDADDTHAALLARGVTIVTPPTDMPFGRALAVAGPADQPLWLLQLAAR